MTFSFKSEKNLCKIYLRSGEIYHISFGFHKGLHCFKEIEGKEILSHNFIPDITIDVSSVDFTSTAEVLENLKKKDVFFTDEDKNLKIQNLEKIKEILKTALIRQIGPIGGKITEKYIKEKWTPSNPPTKDDYTNLINLLAEEIEDPQSKKEFLMETNKILEGNK